MALLAITVTLLLLVAVSEGFQFWGSRSRALLKTNSQSSTLALHSVIPAKSERTTTTTNPKEIQVAFPHEKLDEMRRINDDSFYDEVADTRLAVVFFTSSWCGPCKPMESTLKESIRTFKGNADFLEVDIDESPDVACEFHIRSIPSILFFKDGEVSSEIVGSVPTAVVNAQIENLIEE
jgi:thioredoxin 1